MQFSKTILMAIAFAATAFAAEQAPADFAQVAAPADAAAPAGKHIQTSD